MPSIAVMIQYLLPKQAITHLAGKLANMKGGLITTAVIRWFIKRYKVNMAEAEMTGACCYKTFNDFFTRALKVDARPITSAKFTCPVDGAISQLGAIEVDQIFQAKGHHYSTTALLGGNHSLAKKFSNGHFACIYLSPKDYHRIHMPCDGELLSMAYVPGALFSVNPITAESVPGLFAKNERVVCEFISAQYGSFVMVLVGATIVGSMATVWHNTDDGIINPPRRKKVCLWDYQKQNITLKQGDEMGRFLLGSTVVMLFEQQNLQFNADWHAGATVRLGTMMA